MGKSIRSTQKKRFRAEKRRTYGAEQDKLVARTAAANMDVALGRAPRNPDGSVLVPSAGVRIGKAGFFANDGNRATARFAFRKTAAARGDKVVIPRNPATRAAPDSAAMDPVGVLVGATVLPEEAPKGADYVPPKPGKVRPADLLPPKCGWK